MLARPYTAGPRWWSPRIVLILVSGDSQLPDVPALVRERARAYRFVRRIHWLRTLGLGLGSLCVAAVLALHDAAIGWWVALLANGLVWPQAAMAIAMRSANPRRAEARNLRIDSLLGGMWVAVMQFNLLPSVLLVTMLLVDKVGARHTRALVQGVLLIAAGCGAASAALGFPVQVETPMPVIWACVPFLIAYPLAVSGVTNSLAQRVARQNRLLEELGRTDGLTGLANRRQCFSAAEAEFARHARLHRPAVLLVLDIDHFKDINDRHGHPVGDDVLCAIAAILNECTRSIDTCGRYGGDEFMIVMPETQLRGAEEASQRIRQRLAAVVFDDARELRCTVSMGAAALGPGVASVDEWITRADAALYRAKAQGRDRFVSAEPSAVATV